MISTSPRRSREWESPLTPNEYYLSPDECEIYDLTGGYYMFCDRQNFLRSASKILTALGEDNETLPEFEHTVEIYKIIE